jgi:hypothetical protein
MTIQEDITKLKIKLAELINQKNQLKVAIEILTSTIAKLETIAESENNPNMAADLVKPYEK